MLVKKILGSKPSGLWLLPVLLLLLLVWPGDALVPAPAVHNSMQPRQARPTNEFLGSIGVVSSMESRGQPLDRTIEMIRYGGFRWMRTGMESLGGNRRTTMQSFLKLHRETGVVFSWGLLSCLSDIEFLLKTGKVLAAEDALLAFEGNNEPNNWGVTYQGESGGGKAPSWMAVARLQRDLYRAVKSDPELAKYPVWTVSEPGAQRDNVGLQFLTIPQGAATLMPDGTRYADFANVHNYVFHPNSPRAEDNKTWNAADPSRNSRVDGLFHNFGLTWHKKFQGYSDEELERLPRVTTETGVGMNPRITEEMHGRYLMNLYLAQFVRGYSHTSVYILRDRTDEGGNQAYGFFRPDFTPRKAAHYLHNLTAILVDEGVQREAGTLEYLIADQPPTVHDLLLQRSDGTFQLVVWGERLSGEDMVSIRFGKQHATITLYDPTKGTEPVNRLIDRQEFALALSDHPVIIEITD